MEQVKHICFDRILPRDLHREHTTELRGVLRAIAPKDKRWVNGSTITVGFLSGTQRQMDMVLQYADEWTSYANLKFKWVVDGRTAQIRIAFDPNDGAWSYVGTDNLTIPRPQPTMNLGWQDRGVILHEFGHMVGLGHEHQNPDGGMKWNEQEVIDDLAGPPNYWDEATVRHNVIEKYSRDEIFGTAFDPDSIMLYAFPASWTTDGRSTHENSKLSEQDKAFIRSAEMYPPADPVDVRAVPLQINHTIKARISEKGEEDLYVFEVAKKRTYTLKTSGSTDVVMRLYDESMGLIDEDDDSGFWLNARIKAVLASGKYYAQVAHYSPTRTGDYRIRLSGG